MTTLFILLEISSAAFSNIAAVIASAFIVTAASWGIGKIGTTALEAMARQPEAAGDIRGSMVVAAALIEGVSFFAIIICALVVLL